MQKSLAQWLIDIEKLHPREIELGLARIKQVYAKLEPLPQDAKVITVAGTNGKGSTVKALEAIGITLGKRVGMYTSPHLFHYCERIQINQEPVSGEAIIHAFEKIEQARQGIPLTYFEYGTLAALLIFADHDLDWILLEVGLGGRLDAVNIVDPTVAVITTIDFDHQAWLGDTRDAIGSEKAGIVRDHGLFVCGDANPPESVSEAGRRALRAYWCGNDFGVDTGGFYWDEYGQRVGVSMPDDVDHLPLLADNIATALQVVAALGEPISKIQGNLLAGALPKMLLNGRQQLYSEQPYVLLDVGHNPQAAESLANTIERLKRHHRIRQCRCLLGMLADKHHENTISELLSVVDQWWVTDLQAGPRSSRGDHLGDLLRQAGAIVKGTFSSPKQGYQALRTDLAEDEMLVVFGSFYTVAEALDS